MDSDFCSQTYLQIILYKVLLYILGGFHTGQVLWLYIYSALQAHSHWYPR